jgi:hypothetical protein
VMDYAKYANELANKMQQAVLNGRYNEPCMEGVLEVAAAQLAAILEQNGYAPSREVIFCIDTKGGRIEVCIIVEGVTDEAVIHRLNMEHHRVDNGDIVEMGESNIQAYFAEDTDWPEAFYASGEPDEDDIRWAELLKQYR